ncbi:hypothetical protein ACHAPJ_007112 [Fusarium lateritium]
MAISVLGSIDSASTRVLLGGFLFAGIVYALYRSILPRPLEGIPYNVSATKRIFGDLPEVKAFGSMTDWLATQPAKHKSPIFQFFVRPFSKPWIVVADYHEAGDICTQRLKEFDKGTASTAIFSGVLPGAHITLRSSDPQFRKNKELVRNLMTPSFLNEVSAPEIYDKMSRLVELWSLKSEHANGRFFSASRDVHNAALDIIVCASFGLDTQSTQLVREIQHLSPDDKANNDPDGEFVFKEAAMNEELEALTVLADSVAKTFKTPSPPLFHFLYRNLSSKLKHAFSLTKRLQDREIENGIKRRQNGGGLKCALDEISIREEVLAKKEGRKPDYYSQVITSEMMNYLIAGHESTSSAIRWGISYLSANQRVQNELRSALQQAHHQAKAERRPPSLAEILQTRVPYLDAVCEEIFRLSYPFGMSLREASVDTQILGARVPKGTTIVFLSNGPSVLAPPISYDESRSSEWVRSRKPKQVVNEEYDYAGFIPERWLKNTQGEDGKEEVVFDSQAFPIQTFGLGPRGCFGRRMAYLEMKLFFSLIPWTFEMLELPPQFATPKPVSSLTRNPDRVFIKTKQVVL